MFRKQWNKIKNNCELQAPTVKFKVKFYPKDLCQLEQENTRHQFYLQVKHDISRGKLPCSIKSACLLASYVAQSELGDYIAIKHCHGYLSGLQLLRGQNEELERLVSNLHKLHRGQLPTDAEWNYLEHAKRLDLFGVDLHQLTNSTSEYSQLGLTSTGVIIYQNGIRVNTLPWSKIVSTSINRNYFQIKLRRQPNESRDTRMKFRLCTVAHAKSLWKSCLEHYSFARGRKKNEFEPNKWRLPDKISKIFRKTRSKKSHALPDSNIIVNQNPTGIQNEIKRNKIFQASLSLLCETLGSGDLRAQYEKVYHNNRKYPITEAKKIKNHQKNRYSNISPYDWTRVILINSECDDYINANYVNMKVSEKKLNKYIATQGPLPNTTIDFWRMVQQENSHLIVMLTTVMELGVHKCHQYWPNIGDKQELSPGFAIICINEQPAETGNYVLRELVLFDKNIDEKRTIQHMQYLAWPDHGVPSDPLSFLQFTKQIEDIRASTRVHQYISASDPSTIVHCSAGIGRTGVLILMDTALAMISARQPIYPTDMLREMRDQRPGLIQHFNQFRFVCECISESAKL